MGILAHEVVSAFAPTVARRTYKVSGKAVLPLCVVKSFSPSESPELKFGLHGAIRRTFGNYVLNQSRIVTFGIEDLSSLSTQGKGGKLAKAVTWMVKRWKPIAKRLRGWIDSANLPTKIVAVNPRNTSRMHHGCGGALVRDPNHYHEVECLSCGSVVNTHHNSALNIAELARR